MATGDMTIHRQSARKPTSRTKPTITLRGTRILLRTPTPSDRREYCSVRTTNAAYFRSWEPRATDGSVPKPTIAFKRMLKAQGDTCRTFLVFESATNSMIARISCNQIFRGPFQNTIIGYWIIRKHAGKGYMTEALMLALDHIFGDMKLHRVEANLVPRNARSRNLVKRLGFRFEGLAKRYLQIAGRWSDHEHWAITVEEWPRARARLLLSRPARSRTNPARTASRAKRPAAKSHTISR